MHELKKELKSRLGRMSLILTPAMQCLDYSHYLHSPNKEIEQEYISKSSFFKFTRHIFWRVSIIEITKLVSDNDRTQKFNVFFLLKKLKQDGYFGKLGYDENRLVKWQKALENSGEVINEIEKLRNKIYSHSDFNIGEPIDTELTLEMVNELCHLLADIIKDIYAELLDTHADISPPFTVDENFKIIEYLALINKERNDERIREFLESAKRK